jgi:hypothetical protein
VALTNVGRSRCRVEIPLGDVGGHEGRWQDLLSEKEVSAKKDRLSISLQPYDVLWLVPRM